MESMHYVGLDVHKKSVSHCVKKVDGSLVSEGKIPATIAALSDRSRSLPKPWSAAMEATIFSGWIYDLLLPEASEVKVAHPFMLRAISAAKKKNDRVDADRICDLLRCDLLPECRMAPTPTRDLRRVLRYRNLVVQQAVSSKNRMSGLLMETGISCETAKLHQKRHFENLLEELRKDRSDSLPQLLGLSRTTVTALMSLERTLIRQRLHVDELHDRVLRLMTIRRWVL